jgi:hypothetical protein
LNAPHRPKPRKRWQPSWKNARRTFNPMVEGSNPSRPTIYL